MTRARDSAFVSTCVRRASRHDQGVRERIAIHRSAYHTCAAPTDTLATNCRNNTLRLLSTLMLSAVLAASPITARAFHRDDAQTGLEAQFEDDAGQSEYRVAQANGCLSLSEAIEQVRQQTGGRILSAKTKVSGNREIHHIKVLTKDGKVKTFDIPGCRRDH